MVYGCFAAGLASLIIFAMISWFNGKINSSGAEETTNQTALSRGIRITVYLITALLAVASSVISLIDVDQTAGYNIVPVRMFNIFYITKHGIISYANYKYYQTSVRFKVQILSNWKKYDEY